MILGTPKSLKDSQISTGNTKTRKAVPNRLTRLKVRIAARLIRQSTVEELLIPPPIAATWMCFGANLLNRRVSL